MQDKPKSILYKGVKYTINRGYYKTTYGLHRRIWEDNFGEIPEDHHIHHKNGDSLDNRIENLECIHKSKHHSMHFSAQRQLEKMRTKESRERALKWYRSEVGKLVQGNASKKGWAVRKPVERICVICSKNFQTKNLNGTKYCSQKCRCNAGYRARIVEMKCEVCGIPYRREKNRVRTCSRKCAAMIAWRTKRGIQNDPISTTK